MNNLAERKTLSAKCFVSSDMKDKLALFEQSFRETQLPDVKAGDVVRITERVKEESKERERVFEGLVIARKHGHGPSATITVRRISFGVGVEKIYPLRSPLISKITVLKRTKVRRAKLYYVRSQMGKRVRRRKELPIPQGGIMMPEGTSDITKETER